MALRFKTGREAILALLRDDGAAWEAYEIWDWLQRNPEYGPRLNLSSVQTYLHTFVTANAVEVLREVGKDNRYRYLGDSNGR